MDCCVPRFFFKLFTDLPLFSDNFHLPLLEFLFSFQTVQLSHARPFLVLWP